MSEFACSVAGLDLSINRRPNMSHDTQKFHAKFHTIDFIFHNIDHTTNLDNNVPGL